MRSLARACAVATLGVVFLLVGSGVANAYVYWVNEPTTAGVARTVGRATLTGGDVTPAFATGSIRTDGEPGSTGIAVDSSYVYWSTSHDDTAATGTISRARLDGTGSPDLNWISGIVDPRGIAIDPVNDFIYWTSYHYGDTGDGTTWVSRAQIQNAARAATGGPPPTTLVNGNLQWIKNTNGHGNGIAIANGYLYWTDGNDTSQIDRWQINASASTNLDQPFVSDNVVNPSYLATNGSKLYWPNNDGFFFSHPVFPGTGAPTNLSIAKGGGVAADTNYMYWGADDGPGGHIGRATVSGGSPNTEFITGATGLLGANGFVQAVAVDAGIARPSAPTIGTATLSGRTGTVNWTAPTSDGGSALTGYTVTTSTNGGAYAPVGAGTCKSAAPSGGSMTSCTVTDLTPGSSYRFKVGAKNAAGVGAASGASNALVVAKTQSITFTLPSTYSLRLARLNLTGSASSGLTVRYSSSTSAVCTVKGNVAKLKKPGTCTLHANQPGNSTIAAAPTVTRNTRVVATAPTVAQICPTGSCAGVDLSGVDLSGMNLSGVDFTGANLAGANLTGTKISGANFTNANLTGIRFGRLAIRGDVPAPARKKQVIIGANFTRANLTGASMANLDLRNVRFTRAVMTGIDLRASILRNPIGVYADLTSARLQYALLVRGSFAHGIFNKSNLTRTTMIGTYLRGATFKGAVFNHTRIVG